MKKLGNFLGDGLWYLGQAILFVEILVAIIFLLGLLGVRWVWRSFKKIADSEVVASLCLVALISWALVTYALGSLIETGWYVLTGKNEPSEADQAQNLPYNKELRRVL